ncbi:hypothetical protein Hdeb2414_s0016g00487431 [Helianthus debilis subsp. tardiflorus]
MTGARGLIKLRCHSFSSPTTHRNTPFVLSVPLTITTTPPHLLFTLKLITRAIFARFKRPGTILVVVYGGEVAEGRKRENYEREERGGVEWKPRQQRHRQRQPHRQRRR